VSEYHYIRIYPRDVYTGKHLLRGLGEKIIRETRKEKHLYEKEERRKTTVK
jgi:hypothetical protein